MTPIERIAGVTELREWRSAAAVLRETGADQRPRWRVGERLEQLFEERCDATPDRLAVDATGSALTFAELDGRANRLARHLLASGVGPGARVALLLDDPVQAYVGMLGVLKAGAAYVPLDRAFPSDRLAYIVADAGVGVVLTLGHLSDHLRGVAAAVICVDDAAREVANRDDRRLSAQERGSCTDQLAYVIYTSGSTGRPKGVAVEHASICNFVRVAAEVYGVRPGDRMYQGLTMAFDFSIEEIWVPWAAGATLVPKPSGSALLGADLHEFLVARGVTAMCCVPTLLATLEEDLPDLRFLLVSGEACPHDLIVRWHRPGRRFLNVYGPTEATVTATWTVVDPGRPVTIGVPLPTYSVVVLDPEDPGRVLPRGRIGELGIAGIGLAVGYVNRDDLTREAFVPDVLGIPENPTGRIYRTGDLGQVRDDGEIEYLGRIDLQVKIRGFRIELTEIESVMLQVPGVAQAVVDTYQAAGTKELVGYYSRRSDADVDEDALLAHLRQRLPPYMVPAYLEHLDVIPMTTQNKADRKNLPAPTARRSGNGAQTFVAPVSPTETVLAGLLAETLGLDRVSVASHFFDDLGADSLLLARFAAHVRRSTALPSIAMKDMYLHPTVAALAGLADSVATQQASAVVPDVRRVSTARYLLCGAAQLAMYVASTTTAAILLVVGLEWMRAASSFVGMWQRSIAFTTATFAGFFLVSVAAKWLLVGRWKAEEFPLWGWRYLRFWLVRTVTRVNPLAVFVGSPLYNMYLRALGARIGAGVVVLSRTVPVCTDLFTIGAGTVVRKDSQLNGYRAVAGRIQIGPVTIGADAVVGEHAVIDIDAAVGNRAQLGHSSSLQSGQSIPEGESWHGSPARRCDVDYRLVQPARCGRLRRFAYGVWQLFNMLVLSVPLGLAAVLQFLAYIPLLPVLMQPGETAVGDPGFYLQVLGYVTALFVLGIGTGLVLITTVPRLFHLGLRADRVYPLYGICYWLQRVVSRSTNSRFYTYLFGDSGAILHYLRFLGYRFGLPRVQSGSNFGVEVKHESPYLSSVGSGTMVSDGLSLMNAEFSNTSFRIRHAALGERSFLGNDIAFPAGGRAGDNCLLATKVMVPLDGDLRRDVGLLGSPPFEIPRSVQRDHAFDELARGKDLRSRLRAKNRHNTVTATLFLLSRLVNLYVVAVIGLLAFDYYFRFGFWVVAAASVASLAFSISFQVLVERAVTSFRSMRPQFCSIYDPYFWWHERFWKMSPGTYLAMFNGTPMKNLLWRALGVRIGRKVFDDGCAIPEKTLVTVGDYASLNPGSAVQAHSLEDGAFKSDYIVLGPGVTLGPNAFVHYGVTVHEGAVLDADSFLMKGQEVPARTRWQGNPAAEKREPLRAGWSCLVKGTARSAGSWSSGVNRWPASVARRAAIRDLVATGAAILLVALQVVLAALSLPAEAREARLVDAAFAASHPPLAPPVPVGLDDLAAWFQLSAYATLAGSFDRHADAAMGARELALVACAVLLGAVLVLARSLGVRGIAVAVVLGALAVCSPAVAVLATFGSGLLGAAWLTAGAALLARDRPWRRVLAVPAILAGVASAPVLAVPVPVIATAMLVAHRVRRGAPLLEVAGLSTVLSLALLAPPAGPAATPALLAVAVLTGFVLVEGALIRLERRSRPVRYGAIAALATAGAVALALVLVPAPNAPNRPGVAAAPELAAWLGSATDPTTGVSVPPGVWANLLRAGVPAGRLVPDGALAVTVGVPGPEQALAHFGHGSTALHVAATGPPPTEHMSTATEGVQLADNPNLDAPDEVRALLRAGAVDPRAVAVLAGLAARGPVALADLPVVPGEDPALPRHRAVLTDLDAEASAWLAAQQRPYLPIMAEPSPSIEPDGPAEPEVAEPEVAEPEVAEPEVAEPEAAEPEAAEPEAAEPEAGEPEAAEPEVAETEATETEAEDDSTTLTWPLPAATG